MPSAATQWWIDFGAEKLGWSAREEVAMAYSGAVALPIVPGQEDRVRNFGQEVAQHQEEWERLNDEAGGYKSYRLFLQETPMGNLAITTFELEDPSQIRQSFTGSAHDTWWLDYLRDVHGIDLRNWPADQPPPAPPPMVFEWRAP